MCETKYSRTLVHLYILARLLIFSRMTFIILPTTSFSANTKPRRTHWQNPRISLLYHLRLLLLLSGEGHSAAASPAWNVSSKIHDNDDFLFCFPNDPSMKAELQQMKNNVLNRVIEKMDDDTLLIVLGDPWIIQWSMVETVVSSKRTLLYRYTVKVMHCSILLSVSFCPSPVKLTTDIGLSSKSTLFQLSASSESSHPL